MRHWALHLSFSKSFKMVRDTVRYKQFSIKTVSDASFKTHMRHWALHMSSSKSFKLVRDTVRYQQFCIKSVSNTSFKTHMRHWALHMSSSKSFKMVRDTVRYKQSCAETTPSFVGGTLGGTQGEPLTMSIPNPSKWSEILSVISSSASKAYQTQASRHTCGTELCTCHLPRPSKWSEILSVISSLASKPC